MALGAKSSVATGACEICTTVYVSRRQGRCFEHACPCGVSHHICWSCIQQFRLEPAEPLPQCPQSDEFRTAAVLMRGEDPLGEGRMKVRLDLDPERVKTQLDLGRSDAK